MDGLTLNLDSEMVALLRQSGRPVADTVKELLAMELYRRGAISGGKAAEVLGMSRLEFIHHADRLGLPYFSMSEDEWREEVAWSGEL
jgi:predicted HTH domain antitoxin